MIDWNKLQHRQELLKSIRDSEQTNIKGFNKILTELIEIKELFIKIIGQKDKK